MGFFKDFKDDFSDAVNELVPDSGDDNSSEYVEPTDMNDSLDEAIDVDDELSKLDGLFEQVSKKVESGESITASSDDDSKSDDTSDKKDKKSKKRDKNKNKEKEEMDTFKTYIPEDYEEPAPTTTPTSTATNVFSNVSSTPTTTTTTTTSTSTSTAAVSDENAVITKGMTINGSLESTGSINIEGTINGDITCNGKLVITGYVQGNSNSAEFFADAAKVDGEVNTTGTAKVGVGSVVKGNIIATSAVIAGAVKGDIDVQGPVVVDTSAVVVGNIKSRSVQINNGAVIEGFCSQTYSDVDVDGVFGS